MNTPDSFDRFISALHRRAVVIRLVERVGICLGTAAGIACVMTLLAEYRGVSTGPIVPGLIALAVIIGVAWGLLRPPARLTAVVQADQQLKLDDLLSSAMTSSPSLASGDFSQAVRAMAIRATANRSPSEVMLNRFGARAWGGVGLAWAMVLVLTLLAGNSANSRAGEPGASTVSKRPSAMNDPHQSLATGQPAVGGHEASSDDFSHRTTPQDSQSAATLAQGKSSGQSALAGGEHASQTNAAHANPSGAVQTGGSPATDPTAQPAVGNGAGSPGLTTPGRSGNTTTARPTDHSAAPWSSDHWPTDRAAALQAVDAGRVPDAYRDLVRDYFSDKEVKLIHSVGYD